ncbi:MAG: DNA-directed RNA polymerase subunit omega [Candidatus Sumerlaeia bacterium]|nr:DNA-directed RNA polymerase subunit omega [Candidatus Sumerlaeia bacterium]
MEDSWAKMFSQGQRKYQVVNVIARRARQLNEGERPAVLAEGLDPIRTAIEELKADKLRIHLGPPADRAEPDAEA